MPRKSSVRSTNDSLFYDTLDSMRISLVIPAYNEEKFIGACLESVIRQTRQPDEIIVVDNNCTDRTIEIAKQYPVQIVYESERGIIQARNAGFSAASGDIIARTDADTLLPPQWVETVLRTFGRGNVDAVGGSSSMYDMPLLSTYPVDAFLAFMKVVQRGTPFLVGFNMAITETMWRKVLPLLSDDDTHIHEDMDLAMTLAKTGARVRLLRALDVQTSGRRFKESPFSFFVVYPLGAVRTIAMHSNVSIVRNVGQKIPSRIMRKGFKKPPRYARGVRGARRKSSQGRLATSSKE